MKITVKLKILLGMLFAVVVFCWSSIAIDFSGTGERLSDSVYAAQDDEQQTVPDSVDDLLDMLDLDGLQGIVNGLDGSQSAVFGFSDIGERIRAIANGEYQNDYNSIIGYVLSLVGADITEFMPLLLGILAIVVAYGIINSIKGKFASEAIGRVVYFATGGVAVCMIVGYFSSVISSAVGLVASIKNQINNVAPVILTLMTAAGAESSAGVYTPTVALLGSGMTSVVTYMAFPALLMGLVFDIIDGISTAKLGKSAEFFRSACKWFLGTAFFIFVTVIGVSGITASVRDGISVRAARFAVSKYIPIIGGYLSQGFDFIMAGNVLIKNAVGSSAIALILLTVAPVISKIAVFTLTLKLTAAICEPLGGEKFGGAVSSVAKSSSLIASIVIAVTVLYVMFLAMLICTGNVGI